MVRTWTAGIAVFLAAWCAAAEAGSPLEPGSTLVVQRETTVDVAFGDAANAPGLSTLREIHFVETVGAAAGGQMTASTKTILDAKVTSKPRNGMEVEGKPVEALAKRGEAFRWTPEGVRAAAGGAVPDELEDDLAFRSTIDLLPGGELTKGRTWAFDGKELARRLPMLYAKSGRIELRVVDVAPAKTGLKLQTAVIEGTLRATVDMDEFELQLVGTVRADVPVEWGFPQRLEIQGQANRQRRE